MLSSKFLEKIKSIFDKMGFNRFILLGLLGVCLIVMSEFTPKENKKENTDTEIESYTENMKKELEVLLSQVDGAGDVKVMLTLESGEENIYAVQEKTSEDRQVNKGEKSGQRSTYENEVVMVSAGADKQALIEKTLQPSIQGVIVVCRGADNIKVVSDITNAVSVVLNIPSNRICVIKMK